MTAIRSTRRNGFIKKASIPAAIASSFLPGSELAEIPEISKETAKSLKKIRKRTKR